MGAVGAHKSLISMARRVTRGECFESRASASFATPARKLVYAGSQNPASWQRSFTTKPR
jgi:hypothetical protein